MGKKTETRGKGVLPVDTFLLHHYNQKLQQCADSLKRRGELVAFKEVAGQ